MAAGSLRTDTSLSERGMTQCLAPVSLPHLPLSASGVPCSTEARWGRMHQATQGASHQGCCPPSTHSWANNPTLAPLCPLHGSWDPEEVRSRAGSCLIFHGALTWMRMERAPLLTPCREGGLVPRAEQSVSTARSPRCPRASCSAGEGRGRSKQPAAATRRRKNPSRTPSRARHPSASETAHGCGSCAKREKSE